MLQFYHRVHSGRSVIKSLSYIHVGLGLHHQTEWSNCRIFALLTQSCICALTHESFTHASVNLGARAVQYVGIYRTGAISLRYRDAISKKHIKTDYRNIEISQ